MEQTAHRALAAASSFLRRMSEWEEKWGKMAKNDPHEFLLHSKAAQSELTEIFEQSLSNSLLSKRQSRLDLLMPSTPPEFGVKATTAVVARSGKRATVFTDSTTPFSPCELPMILEDGRWKINGKTSVFDDGSKQTTKWI